MTTIITTGVKRVSTTKAVNVGRIWINTNPVNGQPVMSGQMDRDFSAVLSLGAGDKFSFWPNNKREGTADADFRIAVELPIDEANMLIESLNTSREFAKTSNNAVETAIASLEMPH